MKATLTVVDENENSHIKQYGDCGIVNATVGMHSLEINGDVGYLEVITQGHIVVNGSVELAFTSVDDSTKVLVEGNVEHAHVQVASDSTTTSKNVADSLNENTSSVSWDYNGNGEQKTDTALWTEVYHHTGYSASDSKSTEPDWSLDEGIEIVAYEAMNMLVSQKNSDYVARIGSNGYMSFISAHDAVKSNQTITLLKNCDTFGSGEYFENKTNITIDLNNLSLNSTGYMDIHSGNGNIIFENGSLIGHTRIYIEESNTNVVFNNVSIEHFNLNDPNKFIMRETASIINLHIEFNECAIKGNQEYIIDFGLNNKSTGCTALFNDCDIDWSGAGWVCWGDLYSESVESSLTFLGKTTQQDIESSIDSTVDYDVTYSDNQIKYTLIELKSKWTDIVVTKPEGYIIDETEKTLNISTSEGLAWLANEVNSGKTFEGYTVKLTSNIDLSSYVWNPIGYYDDNSSKSFKGTFDGQNYYITNMKVFASSKGSGLFGNTYTAIIKNLNVSGNVKSSKDYVGGIIGHGYATLTNCKFTGNISGHFQVGGLLGSGGFSVTDCSFSGNVNGADWVGGIVGNCQDGGNYTNCQVSGKVTGLYGSSAEDYATGGIAGYVVRKNQQSFINCSVEATVIEGGVTVTKEVGRYGD